MVTSLVPVESDSSNKTQQNQEMTQPRQPENLQGLLRYAVEAGQGRISPNNSSYEAMNEDVWFIYNELNNFFQVIIYEIYF